MSGCKTVKSLATDALDSGIGVIMRTRLVISATGVLVCAFALLGSDIRAQTPAPRTSIGALKKLSVEQLTDVEVTSVSRASERLGGTAAAVTVVTNEDIRRSGVTNVPGALRMVPGLHVARQTSNTWAVSSRGFSSITSEKLLVFSDTRSTYTPLVSGVFWDAQNYLLQDIDRIEVIRGPGATLWGANAVNGVISITTKSARDTQGWYAETSAGTEERGAAAARYGGRIGARTYYRLFGSFVGRDETFIPAGPNADDWRVGYGGGRVDWDSTGGRSLTIQGDVYGGSLGRLAPSVHIFGRPGPVGPLEVEVGGGNVLARYRHRRSESSELQFRVYYDRTHRADPSFDDDLHTFDGDFQHRFGFDRHEVTWGVNERFTVNQNRGKVIWNLDPPSSRDNLVSGFVQDQIVVRDGLRVTGGTKLEHNDFSGFEVQPSGRVAWDLSSRRMVWGAVSRAVRVPTRFERDVAIDVTDPAANPVARLLGNPAFASEKLVAYEVGHRWQMPRSVFIDVAAFHNRYTGLASLEIESPFLDPALSRTVVPIRNRNLNDGRAQGGEVLATVSPYQQWRVTASYAYLDLSIDVGGRDQNRGRFFDGATPRHQFTVRSFLDLPNDLQLDAQLRSLSDVRRLPPVITGEGIPGYTELDVRLAWRGWQQMELSLVGQNLLHDHHPEFGPVAQRGEIQRGVYGKIAWGF
jgi:iron complex outermembrane receptor protein